MSARFDTLFAGASALSVRKEVFADEVASRPPATSTAPALLLTRFTPFRLNRLAEGVSDHLAQVYKRKFGLEIPEWRVIATVGPMWSCTAQHIADTNPAFKGMTAREVFDKRVTEIVPMKCEQTPEDIGNAAVFLASDESAFTVGEELLIDGGMSM